MEKIENPKVFISYAWIDNEFNKKVADFVNRLRQDGVDTVFDQTDLMPGQLMTQFMESAVYDKKITNVLMLLTPEYKEKADSKKGGVGTETQIISNEVYQDTNNTKFIPIIFDKRGKKSKDCVPIYLKSRLFIDLSDIESYENYYVSLVRMLFGAPASVKIPLGTKPGWVDNPSTINCNQNLLSIIKKYAFNSSDKYTILKAKEICSDLIKQIKDIDFQNDFEAKHFKNEYSKLTLFRNTFLNLINVIVLNDYLFEFLIFCFDELSIYINELGSINSNSYKALLLSIFKRELIVSIVAILYKANQYKTINRLIVTPYIFYSKNICVSFEYYFNDYNTAYAYNFLQQLNVELSSNKNRVLCSGLADFWVHNTCVPLVSMEDFVNADILISNLTYIKEDVWFPLSYVYKVNNTKRLRNIAVSLTSQTLSERLLELFGVINIEELKKYLNDFYTKVSDSKNFFGYHNFIEECPLLSDFLDKNNILKNL